MSNSSFCINQRQKEQNQSQKVLALSFVGSVLLHLIILPGLSWQYEKPSMAEKPIELIMVEQPTLEPPKPKEEKPPEPPKPKPIPKPVTPPKPMPLQNQVQKPKPAPTPPAKVTTPTPLKPQVERAPQPMTQVAPSENVVSTPPVSQNEGEVKPKVGPQIAAREPSAKPEPPAVVEGISCVKNCQPTYPSVLDGAEGSAAVEIVVDENGNVVSVTLVRQNSNSQINQQVLRAASKMKFSSPGSNTRALVQLTVNFTVAGSDFDRQARDRQQQLERERQAQEEEKKRQEAQLEREGLQQQPPQQPPQPELEKPPERLEPLFPENQPVPPRTEPLQPLFPDDTER
ncbi:MAG: energy transducer TonB [Gomphosphaeria aponina SAG 52.96 = DSM 107014]|uniref:Energy transducer TonB n=1 Tax=Gomphosphaeria aponina SAG 52.96 = DSM 107014 TaxID=1521640 RepID=A0A941GPC0_9CHRO|nr:energy transducer TonB [Gomphosphaeria aponina SAG 52.96 = DSM 107014]